MRKSFLKTIVATAVVGVVTAVSTVVAMAETLNMAGSSVNYGTYFIKTDTDSKLTEGQAKKTITLADSSTVENYGIKFGSNIEASTGNHSIKFTTTAPATVTLAIRRGGDNGTRGIGIYTIANGVATQVDALEEDSAVSKENGLECILGTISLNEGGTYYVARSRSSNEYLYYLDVDEGVSDNTYSWTVDTSDLTGDFASIEADDFTITPAGDNSRATIKYDADVFNTTDSFYEEDEEILASDSSKVNASSAPISGTEFKAYTYAIKLSNGMFAVKPDVPVEENSEKSFDVTTDITDTITDNGKVTFGSVTTINGFTFSAGIKKRAASKDADQPVTSVQIPNGGTEKITFAANKGDVITVLFSSNGSTDATTAVLSNSNGVVASNATIGSGANGKQYLSIIAPKSDLEYTITASGAKDAKVYAISVTPQNNLSLADCDETVLNGKVIISGTTAYVIVAVSERDAAKASLKTVIGTKRLSFDTGYRQVKANGTTINAADLNANNGGAAELLYGFKITGLTSGAQEELIKHFAVEQ